MVLHTNLTAKIMILCDVHVIKEAKISASCEFLSLSYSLSLQIPFGLGGVPFSGLLPSLPTQSPLGNLGGFGSLINSQQLRNILCTRDRSQLDRFIHFGNNVTSVSCLKNDVAKFSELKFTIKDCY